MNYNKSYKISRMGVGIGVLLILLGIAIKMGIIAYTGLAVVVGSTLLEAIFYRCPKCNGSLSMRGRKPRHCPECGFKLDD